MDFVRTDLILCFGNAEAPHRKHVNVILADALDKLSVVNFIPQDWLVITDFPSNRLQTWAVS